MKIGIALGSGAARGWAHIGVIQALEELGIKIDVVAGCSIGAYVGAAYSSNKLAPLEEWVRSLTEWQVFALMGVGLYRGGLVSGLKVFKALQDNFSEETFEELCKPFACVATDLYSGREINFLTGSVVDAVRASCAIPGLFPPTTFNDRWLVDGGVVNPVPVNLCRHLGADIVFAVNLSADFRPQAMDNNEKERERNQQKISDVFSKSQSHLSKWFKGDRKEKDDDKPDAQDDVDLHSEVAKPRTSKSHPPSMIGVMAGSLDILQARVTRSRLAGNPPDILIEPQLRDFGMMEFYRAGELIEEGRNSVKRIADQIRYQLRLD
ncbi:patatin-like phospholipase RssA [Paraglaciecola polaris]|uniref:NTE family protein rssA n=1 Tax=Paraglaciecola polaris LMG 21857 TaxID=1129793 RepID=K6Z9M8_9ALTE|nr:patatin-like phospholipase RssA [Paraglaciecola polaris]GAC32816.1 NTE family protein rssA [Paraglaciecola polaris LMG 21857]